jgi:hypothetical protein
MISTSDIFENLIRLGPLAIETELAKMTVPIDHESRRQPNKYIHYVEWIQNRKFSKKYSPDRTFLLGYFLQQAGINSIIPTERENFFTQSIVQYQSFLSSDKNGNADMRYFAQWQTGVLQHSLGTRWPVVEGSYLRSLEYDTTRAEALKEVLNYRCTNQEWRIAYIYSSYCIDQFLEKIPANKYWHIDPAFYNWKILKYHIPILMAIREKEKAKNFLYKLLDRLQQTPENFTEKDRQDINGLKKMTETSLSVKE